MKPRKTKEQRFWEKIKVPKSKGACWSWLGYRDHYGYGIILWDGKNRKAHRIAYGLMVGPVPKNLLVCHHCDNPQCCNPEHLFLGTNKENQDDCTNKGRRHLPVCLKNGRFPRYVGRPVGIETWIAQLDDSKVREIRALYSTGEWSWRSLAKKYGVVKSTIGILLKGKTWKHIA